VRTVSREDHLTPAHLAINAYEHARQPKELVILPGGHVEAYTTGLDAASGPARDWTSTYEQPALMIAAARSCRLQRAIHGS
jgi:hypothetical protein